uniref:Ig-like domain-containing protein n=1 Tax=Cyprinodon variegatus TaxID=28743 RepID=A0A3Q2DQ14_CYPVA
MCEMFSRVFNDVKTSDIIEETGVKTAKVGQTLTLRCSCQHEAVTCFLWYKQSLGGKPCMISKRLRNSKEAIISSVYKDRFQVVSGPEEGLNDLIIKDLQPSDSGMYYCVVLEFNAIEFGQGIFLRVKAASSNSQLPVQQSTLTPLQIGDSLNLSCSVSAEPCKGEQSLYWLRHTASQPSLMYPSAKSCIGLKNGPLHGVNCTSNLELNSVMSSDAGTYYCALASCGMVVFGEGTNVEILGIGVCLLHSLLVYFLSVALAFSIIGLLVLSFLRHKLKAKLCLSCKGKASISNLDFIYICILHSNMFFEGQQQEDNAVSICVYSRVRSKKE